MRPFRDTFLFVLTSASLAFSAVAQGTDTSTYSSGYGETSGDPPLAQLTPEERTKAIRELKRIERRSKKYGIILNRGKMERLKGDRLVKVMNEYDRFMGILEELPPDFVKACRVNSVWFSDEIVDASGNHAGGTASGEGINLAAGFDRDTLYHEMFHKFEGCISASDRKAWEDANPDEFIYEGSAWDSFAGNDKQSKRAAERHQRRIAMGKEKTAEQKRDEARSRKDAARIAANKTNETVQAAFINAYAQTTPGEDRAEVFRCMMVEGPEFLRRTARSEHMKRKMELIIKMTGTRRFLGDDFWEEHSDISSGSDRYAGNAKAYPEEMGYDGAILAAIPKAMKKYNIATGAMVVTVKGKTIFEYGETDRPCDISLCWTGLLSILYGRYTATMRIDLEETLESLGITDKGGLEQRERTAKIRDLLSSRSGCFLRTPQTPTKTALPERSSRMPGSEFVFNIWDFNTAADIFEQKAETDIFSAFEELVVRPLGLQDWDKSLQGRFGDMGVSEHYSCRFCLSARDMARIGEMMRSKGKWKGLQILQSSWVEEATKMISKFPKGGGYGYLWWIENENDEDGAFRGAYSARGLEGQRLTVLPELEMVVAHLPKQGAKDRVKNPDYRKLLKAVLRARKRPQS